MIIKTLIAALASPLLDWKKGRFLRALLKLIQTDAKLPLLTPMLVMMTLGFSIRLLSTPGNLGNTPLPQYGGLSAVERAAPVFVALRGSTGYRSAL